MTVLTSDMSGQKVLVAGGAGFIGLNLVERLLREGAEVTVLDYAIPWTLEEQARQHRGRLKLIQGDIRDQAKVDDAVRGQQLLFNLAGKSGAADSNSAPMLDLDVNARGHLTILEACRRLNPEVAVVFPSTRLVYGRPQSLPVTEEHPTAPESFYAIHKLAVEHYLQLYARLHGIRSVILRISNPFGPMQSRDARIYGVVNKFIQQAVNREPIRLFGDGSQRRDYLYIDDLVDALLAATLQVATDVPIINIGGSEVLSLKRLAENVVRLAGSGTIETVPWPENYRQIETGDYVTCGQTAKALLQWQPQVSLEEGLTRTIAYYRAAQKD